MKCLLIATLLALSCNTAFAGLAEGIKAYDDEHYATALKELEPLAEQGDATAQYYIGAMYDEGLGVAIDHAKAFAWYLKSAEQGKFETQFNVGLMYEKGEGVSQNLNKAIEWYKKAIDNGDDGDSQNNLGLLYLEGYSPQKKDGQTIPVNYVQALHWFKIAAIEYDDPEAQVSLGYMYSNGFGVAQSSTNALKYYRLAAMQDNAGGQYNLGLMYQNGEGVAKNLKTALSWYKKAAANGDEDAIQAIKDLKK